MSKKEEDIEELEGGDVGSDIEGFTTDLLGKAKKAAEEDDTPGEEIESPDEWAVADEDEANLDWTGDEPKNKDDEVEEEEEEEEIVEEEIKEEEEVEEKEEKEETLIKPSEEEDKAALEVLKYLEGKTLIKVKGVERDLKDLTPEEIRVRLQKGDRFHEEMDRLSVERRTIEADRLKVNRDAEQVNRLMNQYGKPQGEQAIKPQLPEGLKPHEEDTESEKSLKGYIAQLATQVNQLRQGQVETKQTAESDAMIQEVDSFVEDYPLASREEVLAMKAVRPDIGTKELMEVSHNYYSGDEFMEKYFKVNPDKLREIEEKALLKSTADQQKAGRKAVARKKAGSIVSSKTHTKKKKIPRNFDEIEALMPQIKREYAESMIED